MFKSSLKVLVTGEIDPKPEFRKRTAEIKGNCFSVSTVK